MSPPRVYIGPLVPLGPYVETYVGRSCLHHECIRTAALALMLAARSSITPPLEERTFA